jgi:hypothetical protein
VSVGRFAAFSCPCTKKSLAHRWLPDFVAMDAARSCFCLRIHRAFLKFKSWLMRQESRSGAAR